MQVISSPLEIGHNYFTVNVVWLPDVLNRSHVLKYRNYGERLEDYVTESGKTKACERLIFTEISCIWFRVLICQRTYVVNAWSTFLVLHSSALSLACWFDYKKGKCWKRFRFALLTANSWNVKTWLFQNCIKEKVYRTWDPF